MDEDRIRLIVREELTKVVGLTMTALTPVLDDLFSDVPLVGNIFEGLTGLFGIDGEDAA